MQNPLVTIACITYNHSKYVEQTLDCFLAQEVDFKYEIIVHDDASTDNTQEILKRYKKQYPDRIKLVLQTTNQFQRGVTKVFFHGIFALAKGKYIATCEGDDFWTDKYKLQKQIDFLESNPDFNFSVGKVIVKNEVTQKEILKKEQFEIASKEYYTVKDYLKYYFSQTSTFVFRSGYTQPQHCNSYLGEDNLMVLLATKDKKIKYHNEVFSTYRVHPGGLTQQKFNSKLLYLDFKKKLASFSEILNHKYSFIFTSLKLRIYLTYLKDTTKIGLLKSLYGFCARINNYIRWHIL